MSAKGFTLLEMLVTISIISIISAIGYVNYSSAQLGARDARRKQDLRSISVALELHYQINKEYPEENVIVLSSSITQPWISGLVPDYINALPQDPKQSNDPSNPLTANTYGYAYRANFPNPACPTGPDGDQVGSYYVLYTRLENASDPDLKDITTCDNIVYLKSNSTFAITSQ